MKDNWRHALMTCFTVFLFLGSALANEYFKRKIFLGKVPHRTSRMEENKVCYEDLGCFSMEEPWASTSRPFPAPWSPARISASVALYTRRMNSGYNVTLVNTTISLRESDFKAYRPATVILTHGFMSNGQQDWLLEMKDAYLRNVDANFFILDWGKGARTINYLQVAANTRVVGAQLARFLRYLISKKVKTRKIHLIGHSLGAHIMAYSGKNMSRAEKINRITGLDPAQPGFEDFPEIVRLAPSDAVNVDVIHTDAKPFIPYLGLGMMAPVGTIDFYVNGGSEQPGCLPGNTTDIQNLSDLKESQIEVFFNWVLCSHARSHEYFTASMNKKDCSFIGIKMKNSRTFLQTHQRGQLKLGEPFVGENRKCNKKVCNVIGLNTFKYPSRGNFTVQTDNDPPYCTKR